MNTLVYCTCCTDNPKAMCALGPQTGLSVRRNKGRANTHVAELSPLDVLRHLAGTSDPIEVANYVNGMLERG